MTSDTNAVSGGDDRWYVVYPEPDVVAWGPETEEECQRMAAEIEERNDQPEELGDPIVVDRNGLVAFEETRGREFTYTEHATRPDDVDGGVMGDLLSAAFSDRGDPDA